MANSNLPFSRDAYDDLADLFLTEPAAASKHLAEPIGDTPLPFPGRRTCQAVDAKPAGASAVRPSRLMAIMRVNLPVIAGPWLEQAAAAIASQVGPVVLIRERNGKACLDLVAGRDGQQAAAAALAGPADSLPAAVEQLKPVIACWVVEAPVCAETRPTDWAGYDEVVLLTGADEAATVAAFAQAKSICASATVRPRLSLVVVGSEEEAARRSAGRIAQACEESLDCAIELRAIVRRMQPVPMRHLGRFVQSEELTLAMADALSHASGKPIASPVAPLKREPEWTAPPASVTVPRVVLRPRTAAASPAATLPTVPPELRSTPRLHQAPAAEARSVPSRFVPEEPRRSADREPPATESRPTPPVQPAIAEPSSRQAEPVGTLLSLLGDLQPLEIACPRAPGVELGFDLHGRLHALAEDDSAEALQRLFVASDWVREHGALLTRLNPWLASAACADRGAVEVTPHLFTSRPRERRHLADGSLRIHILVRDAAGTGRIVAHLELN